MKFTLIVIGVFILAILMLAVFAAAEAHINEDEFMPEEKNE